MSDITCHEDFIGAIAVHVPSGEAIIQSVIDIERSNSHSRKFEDVDLVVLISSHEDLIDTVASKIERVQANAAGSGRRHQRRVTNGLYPNGLPQERVRGALEFLARYGTDWVDELIPGVDPLPTEHVLVSFPE